MTCVSRPPVTKVLRSIARREVDKDRCRNLDVSFTSRTRTDEPRADSRVADRRPLVRDLEPPRSSARAIYITVGSVNFRVCSSPTTALFSWQKNQFPGKPLLVLVKYRLMLITTEKNVVAVALHPRYTTFCRPSLKKRSRHLRTFPCPLCP